MSAPDRFEVIPIDGSSALADIAPMWRDLLHSSTADTLFLTPEWMSAWWSAYAATGEGRSAVVVVARRGRDIVGILPLQIAEERYRGRLPIRALRFLGDGTYDSDYLDFVVPRGEEEEVLPAFWSWLRRGAGPLRYDVARWYEIPTTSPHYALTRSLATHAGTLLSEERIGCVSVALPDSWDEYLGSLRPRMRTKIRSLRRDLEADHATTLIACSEASELHETLDSLFDLHQRRWATRGEPGALRGREKRRFYDALGRTLLERGWLDLHTLVVNGTPVAHQFCGRYQGTVYLLQEGYDPDWESMGVGNVLRAMLLERLIQEGVRTYDFLGGVSQHKLSWGGRIRESARLTVRGSGLRATVVAGLTRLAETTAPIRAALRRSPA